MWLTLVELVSVAFAQCTKKDTDMTDAYWHKLDVLVTGATLVIDRPSGSAHPRYHDTIYPMDYGYLHGTTGGDGEAVDAWRGTEADDTLTGVVCTVDLNKRDVEVKLLLGCTAAEQQTVLQFHTGGAAGAILIPRPSPS